MVWGAGARPNTLSLIRRAWQLVVVLFRCRRAGVPGAVVIHSKRMRNASRLPLCVAVALALVLPGFIAGRVAAEDAGALARARATFQQAVELGQAGNCPAALNLFRQVGQVRMTPQVRFHIAVCEAKLGRLVAALGGYELALADADTVGHGFRDEVEENIRQLRERVPRLILRRGAGADAATIELDGVALGTGSIGVELPLDPGPHSVAARARGYQVFEQTVTLVEGTTHTLAVVLSPWIAPELAESSSSSIRRPASGRRLLPYVVGGAGLATLVGSGVMFALRQGTLGDLEDACQGRVCGESQRDEYDRLKVYHYGFLMTLGAGAAAIGTAVTLIVLDQKPRDQKHAGVQLIPKIHPNEASATVRLRF